MKLTRMNSLAWMREGARIAQCMACALLCAGVVHGQEWARAMFDHTTHDFGAVARGAKVDHRFVIENIYEEDAHIKSVSSSCGCSTPQVSKQLLKTWEKAEVIVTIDTQGSPGRKDATITVVFDQPFPAEVQLHVHANIRGDIVVQPGAALFGSVNQGTSASRDLTISYAGRSDWQVERVECSNPHITTQLAETKRTPGLITYRLAVQLKDSAPAGYFRDQLVLVTNDFDAKTARVPVTVEGSVASALTVRPSPLSLGAVAADGSVTRNLVIQGRAPFRVLSVRCDDDRFTARVPTDSKAVHIVPVTFASKDGAGTAGKLASKIHIETDLPGGSSVDVDATVEILGAEPAPH